MLRRVLQVEPTFHLVFLPKRARFRWRLPVFFQILIHFLWRENPVFSSFVRQGNIINKTDLSGSRMFPARGCSPTMMLAHEQKSLRNQFFFLFCPRSVTVSVTSKHSLYLFYSVQLPCFEAYKNSQLLSFGAFKLIFHLFP